MEIVLSDQVKTWLAQPDSEKKPMSVMLAIEGYADAMAGIKPAMPQGKPMFILGIGRNGELEKRAKEALGQIPVKLCQGGSITVDVTQEQLQSIVATGKFRSARLSSERAIEFGGL